MKICLVAPGWVPIPTNGGGAVEIIIWDYKQFLEKMGDEVFIVNHWGEEETLKMINDTNCDVCHCLYDGYITILPKCNSKVKIIATHYGGIRKWEEYEKTPVGYTVIREILSKFPQTGIYNFVLDDFIKNFFIHELKSDENLIRVIPNGAREDLIKFSEIPSTTDTICLAKIESRKRQYLLKDLDVKFVGGMSEEIIPRNHKNFLGEWSKEKIYSELTNHANLVLLSYSEAAPLVTMEGLMAGLGLVVSESSIANLDLSKPFIDVIPENKITDINYVNDVIQKNKLKSLSMRKEIRKYAEEHFSLEKIVCDYRKILQSIISNS
jgi:glycosyltransferase involved in cell wall biosynthesis